MAVKRWNGTAWEVYAGADLAPVKVTDGRVGKTTFIGATSPTGQVDGDIWIDQDTTTNAVVPTALTTKGDIFAATGNAAYTRFAAGNNGESLYADSTTSTGLRWQGDFNTGKNKVLNGAFDIWQRGTTFINPANDTGYTADRFYSVHNGSGATRTITRETFTPGAAPASGYESQYFLRYNISAPGTGNTYNYITTSIEDVRTFAGQTVTFSFWAKASANINVGWNVDQFFGSGGSAVNYNAGGFPQSTFNLTNSWQRFTAVANMSSISGKTIGTSSYLRLFIALPSNQNITVDTWGWELESGSVASAFTTNTANPQAELAACQRYYYKTYNIDVTPGTITDPGYLVCDIPSLRLTRHGFRFPVTMRSAPSMIVYNPATGGTGTIRTNAATNFTMNGPCALGTSGGFFDFNPSSGEYGFYHIVASAEL